MHVYINWVKTRLFAHFNQLSSSPRGEHPFQQLVFVLLEAVERLDEFSIGQCGEAKACRAAPSS